MRDKTGVLQFSLHAAGALILAATLLVVPLSADTTGWTAPVKLSVTLARSTYASTIYEPATGDILVTWSDDGVAELTRILLRRYDASAGWWLPTENLSAAAESWARDSGSVLVRDSSGLVLAAWTRSYAASGGAPADGHDVVSRVWDGSTWSAEQVIMHEVSYLPGPYNLVPVETTGASLLFIGWGYEHRLATFWEGAWSTPGPTMDLDAGLAQVIVDDQGTLHAAAYGPNSTNWYGNDVFSDGYYLASQTGDTWTVPFNVSSWEGVTNSVGLAFDGEGRLHFLWSDPHYLSSIESQKSAIWERVLDSGQWGPNVDITGGGPDLAINSLSLFADEEDVLHLAWSEGIWSNGSHLDLDVYYRTGDEEVWGTPTRVYSSTLDSRYPLVGLGHEHPYLVWEEINPYDGSGMRDSDVFYSYLHTPAPFTYYLPIARW